jgi:RHS repeat-associated protein
VTNPFRYTGRELDPETGLYYYRARYYGPATGRFLSEDPVAFDAGVDFYAYVGGNPVNEFDPSGLRQRGAPAYDPGRWNDPDHVNTNNCYSYACDIRYPKGPPSKPQPGDRSGRRFSQYSCGDIRAAAKRDGLRDAGSDACSSCPEGYHKVRLFIGYDFQIEGIPGKVSDYHWYREDSNGLWSWKHGGLPVGSQVSDPAKDAKTWGYNEDCGTMCAKNR